MGIKQGTYCMAHWVLHTNNESWNTTSKLMMYCKVTNRTLFKKEYEKVKINKDEKIDTFDSTT